MFQVLIPASNGWHSALSLCVCVCVCVFVRAEGEGRDEGRGAISIGLEKKYGLRPSCLLYFRGDGERNPYRGRAIAVFERLRR